MQLNQVAVMNGCRCFYVFGFMIFLIGASDIPPCESAPTENNGNGNEKIAERLAIDTRIEGEISETLYNDKGTARKERQYRFVAYIHDPYWRIITRPASLDEENNLERYNEVGTDGTNAYQVMVYNPEYDRTASLKRLLKRVNRQLEVTEGSKAIASLKRKKEVLKENIESKSKDAMNGAVGQVNPFPYPEGTPDLIAPVWLAYCSANYFRQISTNKVPRVWTHASRVNEYPRNKISAYVKRFSSSPILPRVVRFHSGYYHYTREGSETVRRRLPGPFNNGYTNAIYTVLATTEGERVRLPKTFELRQYKRRRNAEDVKDVWLARRIRGALTRYETPCGTNRFVPKLPVKTAIQDKRSSVGGGDGGIQYIAAPGRWSRTTNVASLTAFHRTLREEEGNQMGVMVILLGAVLLLPLAFFGFRGVRGPRKIE